jgi:hypothetical protein
MLSVGQGSTDSDTFGQTPVDECFRKVNSAGIGMNDIDIVNRKGKSWSMIGSELLDSGLDSGYQMWCTAAVGTNVHGVT